MGARDSDNEAAFALLAGRKGSGGGTVHQRRCLACGSFTSTSLRVCGDCGGPLSTSDTREVEAQVHTPVVYSHASRTVYIVLALLVGGWGVHNFYAGRTEVGIGQLVCGLGLGLFSAFASATGILALAAVWLLGALALLAWIVKDIVTVRHDGSNRRFT